MSILRARTLRNQMTFTERVLWARLRSRQLFGAKFRRQHPIGPYFADFCCIQLRLIVEVDGGQHARHQIDDARRDLWLSKQGHQVLRFWDSQVLRELPAVVEQIGEAVRRRQAMRAWSASSAPTQPPPRSRAGEGSVSDGD